MIARDDSSKKCRVEQAERIHHSTILVASTLSAWIIPNVQTTKRLNRFVMLKGWVSAVFGSEVLARE
jgi:hypothetical protein